MLQAAPGVLVLRGIPCVYPNSGDRPQRHRSQPYPTPSSSTTTGRSPNATAPIQSAIASPIPPTSVVASSFPAVFYLDRDIFESCKVEIPEPNITIPTDVLRLIGQAADWNNTAGEYFATAHSWMPIISKKHFFEKVLGKLELRAESALLILCMEIITWTPAGQDPRTSAYRAAKHFFLDLEIAGLRTLQVLQAGILIALYEFGHALYPSAAVSIEACVRFGYDLGIDWNPSHPVKKPFSWIDAEEQNRVWWAIVMLDRIRGIGSSDTIFLTGDPPSNAAMPADDTAWDQGVMPPQCLSVYPPKSLDQLGRFLLAAEATKLLGRVFQHVKAKDTYDDAHNEEARLLDRALRALENFVHFEGHEKSLDVMNQETTMAETFNHENIAKEAAKLVARSREAVPESSHQRPIESCVKEASPFLTTLLYQAAVAILRIHRKEGSQESLERLTIMKAALRDLAQRWRASALELHPDKNPNDPQATAKFQNLKNAYDALLSVRVTVEEVAEDVTKTKNQPADEEDKDDDFFLNPNMPRRERKKVEKERRRYENKMLQDQARARKVAKEEEEAREADELEALKIRIDRSKKLGPKQEGGSWQLTRIEDDRVLVLTTKLLNHQRNKKVREWDRMMKADWQAEIEAEEKENEILEFEVPMGFIDPMERDQIMEGRMSLLPTDEEKRMEEQVEEEMEKARLQAEKLKAFWESRRAAEVKPNTVQVVPKVERDLDEAALKGVATIYTRGHLSRFAHELKLNNQLTLRGKNRLEFSSYTNLQRAHYVRPFCCERNGWKYQTEVKQVERAPEPLRLLNSWGNGAWWGPYDKKRGFDERTGYKMFYD
ncbi:uncharacterized protein PAC_04917 [Phialocephala subalpina]|uniref:J domain-containing protein n=1 Tax=Phialocephala subalpina TaxID=576137 RepID=A0A1L7WQJ6_9HELO|nr:uncharacterized protein PAC_04917 [Phialocephala subalpina]